MSTFTLDPSAPVLDCNAFLEPDKLDTWRGYVWRFGFGAVGTTTVYVLTDRETLDDALETAAEWLKANAPGVFTEPDYEDAARELGYARPNRRPSASAPRPTTRTRKAATCSRGSGPWTSFRPVPSATPCCGSGSARTTPTNATRPRGGKMTRVRTAPVT
jgi:hypothetical protein